MTNVVTSQDIFAAAAVLGAEAGTGKDTQIRFMLKMVEGGYHNVLDLSANKHGVGIDDATRLTEAYVKAQQGAVVFNAKSANQRVQISKLRTTIKLGSWPKGGNGEPIATVNNLMSEWQKLKRIPAQAKKLDDAANTLLKYARAQLKRDQLIDGAELTEFCFKPQHDLRSAEEIVESMVKQLDKLIVGKASHSTAKDTSTEIINARDQMRKRLAAIATARGKAKGAAVD
jgi:hypothetical protein